MRIRKKADFEWIEAPVLIFHLWTTKLHQIKCPCTGVIVIKSRMAAFVAGAGLRAGEAAPIQKSGPCAPSPAQCHMVASCNSCARH